MLRSHTTLFKKKIQEKIAEIDKTRQIIVSLDVMRGAFANYFGDEHLYKI
jgi:hypothetical protein